MTTPAAAPDHGRGQHHEQTVRTLVLLEYTGQPRPGWRHQAACAETSGDLFFAETHHPRYDELTRQAKRICASCTVRTDCLAYALTRGERYGIWGGLDQDERARITHQGCKP
jgi:WhiB family transcriptional regulator, redox-sensing transcriptional regulator